MGKTLKMWSSRGWIVVTGGGSGIGRATVTHFSEKYNILTCARRSNLLEETKAQARRPERVLTVQADMSEEKDRARFVGSLPSGAPVVLLVQNAAIGDPARLTEVSLSHLELALRVNVVAPLALTQDLLPALRLGGGRILHLGTSVAHQPQEGSLTYGVTKMAFHRLYQQINAEPGLGVACGSLSPGMVDTAGVQDHLSKARALDLPHVQYFDEAYKKGSMTPEENLMVMVQDLLEMDPELFSSKEWRYSDWIKEKSLPN